MTRLLSQLAARARRTSTGSHYGRAYIFLVVALTIFLLGLACWRQPVTGYTARIGLLQRGESISSSNNAGVESQAITARLRQELLSPDAWNSLSQANAISISREELDSLRKRTNVHIYTKPGGESRIVLWHAGPTDEQALSVVQHLADRFVHSRSQQLENRRRCQQCDAAQVEVAEAASALQQAKEAVESFRRRHAFTRPIADSVQSTSNDAFPTPAEQSPNPLWRDLADRLEVLRAAYAKLLQQRTSEHPEVIDLALQIDQTETELAATPLTIAPVAESVVKRPLPAPVEPSPMVVEQLQKLTIAATLAERRHDEALAAERRAWQDRWSQPVEQIAIVEPAQIVQRHGGGPSTWGVLVTSLVAVIVGGAVAWRSQLTAHPTSLASVAQVERLGIPVAAVLATRDGPAIPQPKLSNPAWVNYLAVGCELLLAAILALVAVVVVADWQVAAHAVRDPLSAFSDAFTRLTP